MAAIKDSDIKEVWEDMKAWRTEHTGIWKDHKGTAFSSFTAMCKKWKRSPYTVKRRLYKGWSMEATLEIPTVRGYSYELAFIGLDGKERFVPKICPKFKQYKEIKALGKFNLFTVDEIKQKFPQSQAAFRKGRMLGIN